MTSKSGTTPGRFLLGLSALLMVIGLVAGGALILQNEGGGFFPNLGLALGLLAIATGNLLSWMVNLFCWYVTRRRWLAIVLSVQTLPAAALLAGLAMVGTEQLLEARASSQRAAVTDAIRADDIAALQENLARCGERCSEFLTPQRSLMLASLYGSHRTAAFLLDQKSSLSTGGSDAPDFYGARADLHTCEGTYLPSLDALELAVAREDPEMLALLWPVSDRRTRSEALWTAARLDRLEMMKFMAGVEAMTDSAPPLVREKFQGEHESLLRAAAAGAAVEVGTWLLEERSLELPPGEIQRAMTDLLGFMLSTDTPRALGFARLLLRHGADIEAVRLDEESALERALRFRSKASASQLLELGAEPASLSEEDRAALEALLQEPDRSRAYGQNREGCVAP